MVKRVIKETISEYDESGKLVKQTVTETTENDDTQYWPSTSPYSPPWWSQGPMCDGKTKEQE